MKKSMAIATAALSLLGLSACGDDGKTAAPSHSSSPGAAGNPSDAPSGSGSTNTGEHDSASGSPDAGGEDLPVVAHGQAYQDPTGAEVRLTGSTCGLASTPSHLTDDNGNEIAYRAPAGKTLCVAKVAIDNKGTQPFNTTLRLKTALANEYSYDQSGEDDNASWTGSIWATGESINPGDSAEFQEIFSVPKGTVATGYVLAPMQVGTEALSVLTP